MKISSVAFQKNLFQSFKENIEQARTILRERPETYTNDLSYFWSSVIREPDFDLSLLSQEKLFPQPSTQALNLLWAHSIRALIRRPNDCPDINNKTLAWLVSHMLGKDVYRQSQSFLSLHQSGFFLPSTLLARIEETVQEHCPRHYEDIFFYGTRAQAIFVCRTKSLSSPINSAQIEQLSERLLKLAQHYPAHFERLRLNHPIYQSLRSHTQLQLSLGHSATHESTPGAGTKSKKI